MRLPYVFPWLVVLSLAACGPAERSVEGSQPNVVEITPRKLTSIPNEATVDIAVDEKHAYVTTFGDTSGSVLKVSLANGGHEVLATMTPRPYSIAIDETSVYFSVRDTGRIHRLSKTGGPVTVVAEQHDRANGAETIAVDATHIYWAAVGGIFRAPKTATSAVPERLAEDDEGAAAIAIDESSVYWIARGTADNTDGAFYKVAKTGGETITLGTGDIFRPTWGFSIAARGGAVYLPDTNRGRVYRADARTGALTLVAEGQDVPVAIAVDDQRVYWSTGGIQGTRSEYRTLAAAPLGGGAVEHLVSTRQANIMAIASNGRGVFFTDYTSTGSVFAVP